MKAPWGGGMERPWMLGGSLGGSLGVFFDLTTPEEFADRRPGERAGRRESLTIPIEMPCESRLTVLAASLRLALRD